MSATILIVEDHEAMRQALRGWLEITFPACRVIEAAGGEEAIVMAEAFSPHVVVMDIGRPGANGLKTTARIKAIAPATQVVVLTSYEAEAHHAHAMASGASACVPRDRITELRSILAGLLSPPNESIGPRECGSPCYCK
jgi:NarL family two-component system response regulator LiaR